MSDKSAVFGGLENTLLDGAVDNIIQFKASWYEQTPKNKV